MWSFLNRTPKSAQPVPDPEIVACPTEPCKTCANPMPIVSFDQACPRCRTVLPAAKNCPGGCGSCEMSSGKPSKPLFGLGRKTP